VTQIEEMITLLADPGKAASPAVVLAGPAAVNPGLYVWWVDDEARRELSARLDGLLPDLIYGGQAGATNWPSGKNSSATLRSRIGGNHLRGNVSSSTFRKTLAALLFDSLPVALEGDFVSKQSEILLSNWIVSHLRLSIYPVADRDTLGQVEEAVLSAINPPLNLQGMVSNPNRRTLRQLRSGVRAR